MKKNGRKYRILQNGRRQTYIENNRNMRIDQRVDAMNIASLAISQIVVHNPIVNATKDIKIKYIDLLEKYLKLARCNRRKYETAELEAYKKIILEAIGNDSHRKLSYYQYYMIFDLMQMTAYDFKNVNRERIREIEETFLNDFKDSADYNLARKIFKMFDSPMKKVRLLLKDPDLEKEREYISLVRDNLKFMQKEPIGVMVTATMSAGKSTFINALTGKYICLSQNLACTSKIHCIVNKAFEDGLSAEYDHHLVLTAGKEELLNDNDLNASDKIVVGTKFTGGLERQRIIVNDSPGVNYSGNETHKMITHRLLKAKNYNLLIYVMNATQLSTNDESEHLDYVKRTVGNIPVLFIINKIDSFNVEEENINEIIKRQVNILKEKGFKNPIVCPVSSRAGYLAKQFEKDNLTRSERRELYNYVDKFDQMELPAYYQKNFKYIKVADRESEELQLIKTSGLAYIEKIIIAMCKGGHKNGTGRN